VKRPDGSAVRIARIDADSTKKQGALESQLAAVHAGEVDVLVGTQMIAKGHDFRRITLVAAVNPDGALFSSDFRAPERLFSLLMQSAGRAGRDAAYLAAQGATAEMWIQTHHAQHPLFTALRKHDYATSRSSNSTSARPPRCRPSPSRRCCGPTRASRRWRRLPEHECGERARPSALEGADLRHRAIPRCRWPSSAWPTWSARRCSSRALRAPRCSACWPLAAAAARAAAHARRQGRDPLAGRRRSAQHLKQRLRAGIRREARREPPRSVQARGLLAHVDVAQLAAAAPPRDACGPCEHHQAQGPQCERCGGAERAGMPQPAHAGDPGQPQQDTNKYCHSASIHTFICSHFSSPFANTSIHLK
jgi:hypothetical protein